MREIRLNSNVGIGPNRPPFVIAEMSGNHNGSLDRALAIVDAAADAGVSALKIQTYTADTMTIDVNRPGFRIDDPKSLWSGRTLYDLYRKASTPWAWHKSIFERCAARGIIGFSTPFDPTAVDFLEKLGVPLYKIASFENVDLPLIRRVARTRKPVIISTGMATETEVGEAVEAARSAGCRDLVLLKCTSAYPALPASANLETIADLRRRFDCHAGLSDHTLGTAVSVAAVALGAVAIEKHFTLKRADGGVDSAFSMEPAEMSALVKDAEAARQARGRVTYGPSKAETPSLAFRRSLYVVRDVRKGEKLTTENIRPIRPGFGLAPKHLEAVLGRTV
ncbi:MAG: pseudaminic acid synthase, partial [Elusimicrobia bacterium]|nr:pseudaminic acid synthase [Elusimicrobiota bacterium]